MSIITLVAVSDQHYLFHHISNYITDGKSNGIKPEFEKFATDNKGIFRIGSLDCEEFKAMCDKESITSLPTLRIYPTFPIPTSDI